MVLTSGRGWLVALPALLALLYPEAVEILYRGADLTRRGAPAVGGLLMLAGLALSTLPSVAAFVVLRRRASESRVTTAVTLMAFGAPAFYTLLHVVLSSGAPGFDDRLLWGPTWAALAAWGALTSGRRTEPARATGGLRLQVAHGVGAAAVLVTFLLAHLGNQLLGLWSLELQATVMTALRYGYRAAPNEAVLLLAFAFLLVTGVALLRRRRPEDDAPDGWRTLQLATGAGLAPFLLAHVSVILGARALLHAETDWTFATGGPLGLLGTLSNARLVPYYWFAVFVLVAHLGTGSRNVLLAHGWSPRWVWRLVVATQVVGAVLATAIVAALCGLRAHR
jgi:hypothetical protein